MLRELNVSIYTFLNNMSGNINGLNVALVVERIENNSQKQTLVPIRQSVKKYI